MRMLIAIRGQGHSEATLRLCAHVLEACRDCDRPTVMTVVEREADRRRCQAPLAAAEERLSSGGRGAKRLTAVGQPAREILREARAGGYGLIVVGEPGGEGHPGNLARRSTTWRVVERAPCSVLIAKGQIAPIRRILLCDSGAHDLPALGEYAARLTSALRGNEEVTVLHVMSQMGAGPGVEGHPLRAEAEELITRRTPEGELLARDGEALDRSGVQPRLLVRHGLVVDEILAEAKSGRYDLVIIGAHRQAGWQRLLLDDLAFRIAAGLDRPVLIAQPAAAEARGSVGGEPIR